MKNIISILFIALLLFSCENQLDSIRPKGQILQSSLNPGDISKLRNGVYSEMEDVVWSVYFDFDVRGDNFKAGPGFSLDNPVVMSPDQSSIRGMWSTLYFRLRHVNFLIETIEELNDSKNNTIKGEMYFFRALIYYNLVTRWGGVPILKKRTYDIVQRSTEQEVWDFILSDLQVAEANMGSFTTKWYASQAAVYALSARVYQAKHDKKDNAKVIDYCNKIIALNSFTLSTTALEYANMFIPSSSSREVLFAFINNNPGNRHRALEKVNDVDPTWEYSPSRRLFDKLYADSVISTVALRGDKRKTAVFSTSADRVIKHPNGVNGQQLPSVTLSQADFCPLNVFRYSEILLMKAEAQGPGSAAAATLRPYLVSRYTTPPTEADIAALNAIDFQNLILNERRREFFAEGHWWYDIKRTDRKDLLPSLNGRDHLMYYPIPLIEKDLTGYTQNPGY